MWLLAGRSSWYHSTIARFRTGFLADGPVKALLPDGKTIKRSGEVVKGAVFIDGTKLEACANKYLSGKNPLENGKKKCSIRFKESVQLLNREYLQLSISTEYTQTQDLQTRFVFGRTMPREYGFCAWAWKTKAEINGILNFFSKFLERQTIYDWHTQLSRKEQLL